ncbi:A disintegrin and metalloproteinase with thrombospondin motifs 9-like [Ctenocephalides felis]|uniref:A disintegrin and metalloproteinase with thrombospondin motifs 9-like n=1 Tax=Ctenocephalides felis TaxID=7515 RepID=UPI000E6E51F7|nr:A disintegrin and metalloproteinase with thrombospondin motifs 9-like [Ctenocephalides felis]
MTSRLGQRASTIAAVVAIVFLVCFIGVLWATFRHGAHTRHQDPPPALPASYHQRESGDEVRTTPYRLPGPALTQTAAEGKPDQQSTDRKSTTKAPQSASSSNVILDNSNYAEYVKPIKIDSPPFHELDLLYGRSWAEGSDDGLQHSGHFRHNTAEIWDPHPQYEIRAFGNNLRLVLEHNDDFVAPHWQMTHNWDNATWIPHRGNSRPEKCFYKGRVRGDDRSTVAVSLCDGMTGTIRTSKGSYFIEPREDFPNNHTVQSILHVIYRASPIQRHDHADDEPKDPHCALDDTTNDVHDEPIFKDRIIPQPLPENHRSKRSVSDNKYYIEVLVAVDRKMKLYHDTKLQNYVLTLMSIVSQIYKDASIGNSISIALVELAVLEDLDFDKDQSMSHSGVSASNMLRGFCSSHRKNRLPHDTAILLTRENICRSPHHKKCDTLGLAELGTMCQPKSSCAIVQDNGLSAAFTIAHELGHVLNMPHDDDDKCAAFRDKVVPSAKDNIMSRMLDHNTYPWSWSQCSRHFITDFLEANNVACLRNKPSEDLIDDGRKHRNNRLPGEEFSGNRQCELVFGNGSKLCTRMPVCTRLWCMPPDVQHELHQKGYKSDGPQGCRTQHMPWADGTPCGPGSWCHKGECVSANRNALKATNGGWGQWQGWGACSRTCGGGVQSSVRQCDSPAPSNGGQYCEGLRVRYRSCNTDDCPPEDTDYREQQCAEFNKRDFKIDWMNKTQKWVPKYGVSVNDRCKLYCRVQNSSRYFLLKDKVVDGTRCSPDSFNKCVNGICKKAGCDNKLDSDMKLDRCGICGGDGSTCYVVTGSYNQSSYGYHTVVKIPKGASNLEIIQRGYRNSSKDDNFLALMDGHTSEYILNGNDMVNLHRKLFVWGGVTIEYTGSNTTNEKINSSRTRQLKYDLIVQVLSVGQEYPPDIVYEYTESKRMEYMWKMSSWSSCDRICQGVSYQTPQCVHRQTQTIVSDDHCGHEHKPDRKEKTCNDICTLSWDVASYSECSVTCGKGIRRIHWQCIRKDIYDTKEILDDIMCSHVAKQDPSEGIICERSCPEWKFSEWTPCSCTTGLQNRTARCVDFTGKHMPDYMCDSSLRKLQQNCESSCAQWVEGPWTPCSATCGSGIKKRALICKLNDKLLSGEYCQGPSPKTEDTCEMEPCPTSDLYTMRPEDNLTLYNVGNYDYNYDNHKIHAVDVVPVMKHHFAYAWRTGLWGECSCTKRERVRLVECMRGNEVASPILCSANRPLNRESCEDPQCGKWIYGDWGQCQRDCMQRRQVVCQHKTTRMTLPDSECDPRQKMQATQFCKPDLRYQWTCTRSRGRHGIRCKDMLDFLSPLKDDHLCSQCYRQHAYKDCKTHRSPWRKTAWSPCIGKCGEPGHQVRNVTCVENIRQRISRPNRHPLQYWRGTESPSTQYCNIFPRPSSVRTCDPVCSYHWVTKAWQKCSHTCGRKGRKKRHVYCSLNGGTKEYDEHFCSKMRKPNAEKNCNRRKKCIATRCKEVRASEDGEYTLIVNGKTANVYCSGMKTANPLEYISLPAGYQENRSDFVDKRRYTLECMKGSHECKECDERGARRSTTFFGKVRLNITSLQIIVNDTRFTEQHGGEALPFANAGDCTLNGPSCTQGWFAIDLSGTDFRIHSQSSWNQLHSNNAPQSCLERRPTHRKVMGHSGGTTCGTCIYSRGLYVQVT